MVKNHLPLLYLYWQCVGCGALAWTEKRMPGMCIVCGTNCWRSPPIHPPQKDDE